MGKGGCFRHGHFRRDQQVQAAKGFFISRGIRVGAQRVRTGNQNRPQPFGMIGQNLFRHDVRRERSANRKRIRGHRPPDLGIPFVGMGTDRHHVAVDDIAAGHAEPAADRLQNDDQVRVQTAVPSHENPQIIAQRRLAGGVDSGNLADLIIVQLAGFDCGAGVEILEVGFHVFQTRMCNSPGKPCFPSLPRG